MCFHQDKAVSKYLWLSVQALFDFYVLKNLDVEIYEGDFTVIMGSSGAGKSTLLYALSGMDKPTLGTISFSGRDISNLSNDKLAVFRRDNCGFVFQQTYLLDNMSILDNILACGFLVSKNRKDVVQKAKDILNRLNLEESTWRKFPAQVSGGEAQRAGIARALINNPKIIFADEPTGALNSANGKAVLDAVSEINERGQSIVMVTHDLRSARRGNRILYIRDGVIHGECLLGKYVSGDSERQNKLNVFLTEMGW
jgi:putative ABC transport system ATP-binding protein